MALRNDAHGLIGKQLAHGFRAVSRHPESAMAISAGVYLAGGQSNRLRSGARYLARDAPFFRKYCGSRILRELHDNGNSPVGRVLWFIRQA